MRRFCAVVLPLMLLLAATVAWGSPAGDEPATFRTITVASQAAIVTDNTSWSTPEQKAAAWLHDEILARTGMNIPVVDHSAFTPSAGVTAFLVGRLGHHALIDSLRPSLSLPSEAFHLEMLASGGNPYVICTGADKRGTLYAVGKCLRKMSFATSRLVVPTLNEESAPALPIRGHQLGYRDSNDTLDKWNVARYEQYFRDLMIFGANSVELIPPRSSSNPGQGLLMPLNPWEMTLQLCNVLDNYDLNVWMWIPADVNLTDSSQRAQMLADRTNLFAACNRIDAIFIPGGDPGSNTPAVLMSFVHDLATAVRTYHPSAQVWVSHQGWEISDVAAFYSYLQNVKPTWLTGVAYGPWTRDTLPHTRAMVPSQYPIRRYPDIGHCLRSELPARNWDQAFARTEGRQPTNFRPVAQAHICNLYKDDANGTITYSDSAGDDVNKMVWSACLWDPEISVTDILADYNRYFFRNEFGSAMVSALLGLESNWAGAVTSNTGIDTTLAAWQAMERTASAYNNGNWRFQQGLFRAYYDAYVKARRTAAAQLEQQAYQQLGQAATVGTDTAIRNALTTLASQDGSAVGASLRARIQQLGATLYSSIGLQSSVPLYGANSAERGAVLDWLDEPLNNRIWLTNLLNGLLSLSNNTDKLAGITQIVGWENPGPDGYYDDLGNGAEGKEPHLVHAKTWEEDPGYVESAQDEFDWQGYPTGRLSWRSQGETLYETPLQVRYDNLDPTANYTLRVTYAGRFNTSMVLTADGTTIHAGTSGTNPPTQYEYPIPAGLTADGSLTLSWRRASASSGRGPQVAEAWLMRSNPAVVINGGADIATQPTLNLALWARRPREMRFSYPGSVGWTAWEPFAFTKQITVTSADGPVQVSFKVRYTDMTESAVYSDTITLSTAPLAQVLTPNGGEAWAGTHSIAWSAADPNGDDASLRTDVLVSSDGGTTWTTVAAAVPNVYGSYGVVSFDTTLLPDSTQCMVKVAVTGGNGHTGEDACDAAFTVDNLPPRISDQSPADGALAVPVGTSISFKVLDDGAGVDGSSIAVTVNGQNVTPSCVIASVAGGYQVTYTPGAPFSNYQVVQVGVEASDLAQPTHAMQEAYSFATGPAPVTLLSSGYVTPGSGDHDTDFYYRIKYWDTYNRAPDQVWCAIWWGTRKQAVWYPMYAYDPSDTNYADGKWYTLRMRWLDSSIHAFRFAAFRGGQWVYWPSPTGTYQSGPAVTGP